MPNLVFITYLLVVRFFFFLGYETSVDCFFYRFEKCTFELIYNGDSHFCLDEFKCPESRNAENNRETTRFISFTHMQKATFRRCHTL